MLVFDRTQSKIALQRMVERKAKTLSDISIDSNATRAILKIGNEIVLSRFTCRFIFHLLFKSKTISFSLLHIARHCK